jgi:uncharacterized protein
MDNENILEGKESNFSGKGWAVGCHVLAFMGGFFFFLGGPIFALSMWVVGSWIYSDSELVQNHGKEAVNFQISLFVWMTAIVIVGSILTALMLGTGIFTLADFTLLTELASPIGTISFAFSVVLVFTLLLIVQPILVTRAVFHALGGKTTRYPLTIRFLK